MHIVLAMLQAGSVTFSCISCANSVAFSWVVITARCKHSTFLVRHACAPLLSPRCDVQKAHTAQLLEAYIGKAWCLLPGWWACTEGGSCCQVCCAAGAGRQLCGQLAALKCVDTFRRNTLRPFQSLMPGWCLCWAMSCWCRPWCCVQLAFVSLLASSSACLPRCTNP